MSEQVDENEFWNVFVKGLQLRRRRPRGEQQDKIDELANKLWHVFMYDGDADDTMRKEITKIATGDVIRPKLREIASFVLRNYTRKEK